MRKLVLGVVGALILLFTVDSVLAQEPNQQAEPNRQAGVVDQREQLRQQAKERMRQRALQRRGGEAGFVRTLDANAPAGAKVRDEQIDKTIADNPQLAAIEQQIAGEENKHRDRTARLNRVRELAQQQNNADTLARVDKLVEQEKRRYDVKTQRMKHRRDMVVEFSQRNAPVRGGADANKNSNQPRTNEPVGNK
jgi:hypothetical protein